MPSRSAHRAALRRAKEPGVIAPEGVTLPELPEDMGWRNPVRGDAFDRDEWQLYQIEPGASINLATIRREKAGGDAALLSLKGELASQVPLPLAQAFDVAAEHARQAARR
ncbi:hypothetical protein GGR77_001500 [Xanthomonas translucens]